MLYYLNLFNVVYFDCPALLLHIVYSLSKAWGRSALARNLNHKTSKIKGQMFQSPSFYLT